MLYYRGKQKERTKYMDYKEMIRLGIHKMTPAEMLKYFPYEAPIEEQVYDSLMGFLIPECTLDWVENIFVPGQPCYESYHKMSVAYDRLLDRLGLVDEDRDAEVMVSSLIEHARIIGYKMFEYGKE